MRRLPAMLAALAVAGGVTLVATPAEAASPLQFGKFYYNSPGSESSATASLNGEYFVVKNTSSTSKCLTKWTVRDVAGHTYTFGSFCLGGYKSVVVHTGRGTNTASHRYWGRTWHVWNNDGDTAYLRNGAGTLMDKCSWIGGGAYKYC